MGRLQKSAAPGPRGRYERRGDNKARMFTLSCCEPPLRLREREAERVGEREGAHIHQAEPIDAHSLERGALKEAGGPHQRGGISGGRTSEGALLFCLLSRSVHILLFPLTPPSDVALQHMSTLNLGLLLFMDELHWKEASRGRAPG